MSLVTELNHTLKIGNFSALSAISVKMHIRLPRIGFVSAGKSEERRKAR